MSGRQRTRGFVLLPVVLLLALLAVIGYLYNQAGALQGHLLSDGEDMDQARYVAEAGLNHALARTRLAGCGPYTDLTDEPFGTAHYSTTLALNNVGSTLTTVRVPVTDDAWLEQNNGSANHGSDTVLQLGSSLLGTASDWPVIRFDIANAGIPAGASVVSAVAYLYVEQFTHSLPVTVHRLTAAWNESTVTWNSLGSSYDSTVTTSISAGTASGRYVAVNLSGLVQSWLAGAQPNDGIVLIPNVLNAGQTSRYASKEDSNAAVQPYLSITYTDGPLADRATLTATGILATGTRDTLVRSGVPLYQLPTARVVQFGSELRDTSVRGTNPDRNYGADKKLYVDGG